jgi:hypothetical protein
VQVSCVLILYLSLSTFTACRLCIVVLLFVVYLAFQKEVLDSRFTLVSYHYYYYCLLFIIITITIIFVLPFIFLISAFFRVFNEYVYIHFLKFSGKYDGKDRPWERYGSGLYFAHDAVKSHDYAKAGNSASRSSLTYFGAVVLIMLLLLFCSSYVSIIFILIRCKWCLRINIGRGCKR